MTRLRALATVVTICLVPIAGFAGSVAAQPPSDPPPPFAAPNTDACPNKTAPPAAIDESEVPAPGDASPTPLPVPSTPRGGERLAECGTITPTGGPALPPDISATGWLLFDLDSGKVLAAKDPHGRYRPASTIKTLLAIVALRELDLNRVVTGTTADADADGTRVGIGPGGRYTNLQLMQALVMASGNDAAHAIATQLGGDEKTVQKMNDEAKTLGASDTRVATPSGLDGPGMSTSPYDLALIFREAMRNPTFAQLIHTEEIQFPGFPPDPRIPGDKDHPPFPVSNDNHLLYDYEGALGGKTGYTDDARQTFVAGAQRDGRRLAVTLLKADVLPIRPAEQAARLLDYGFALNRADSVGDLVEPSSDGSDSSTTEPTSTAPPEASATVAAPPGRDNASGDSQFARDLDKIGGTKTVLVLLGLVAVLLLLVWARRLARRR